MVKNNTLGFLTVLLIGAICVGAEQAKVTHPKLLAAGLNQGAVIIENGKITKTYKTPGYCQDAWMLKDRSVLAVGNKGVIKYGSNDKVLIDYKPTVPGNKYEIHTCMPLPHGGVMIAVNGPGEIIELDAKGKETKKFKIPGLIKNVHMQIRNVRKRKNGEYVISACKQSKIIILKADGTLKREIDLKKLLEGTKFKVDCTHGLQALANGNILVGTGFGGCFIELDKDNKIVWSLTGNDIPGTGVGYGAGAHRLKNGNTVISAYRNAYTLFEVTPDKKVLWKISGKEIGKMTHVQRLDEPGDPSKFGLQK
jgi:hypothetical protein